MVIATGLDNNARCHILDPLQLIKQFIRNTIQKTISIIRLRYYKGVNQEFSRMLRQAIPDRANPAYVEKRSTVLTLGISS